MSDDFDCLVCQLELALVELITADYVDSNNRRQALKLEAKQRVRILSQRIVELADRV